MLARRLAPRDDLRGRPGAPTNERAVDTEVLVRQQRLDLGLTEHRLEKLSGDLAQPVAVFGEHRDVPHRRGHRQADEPAEPQVVVELFHQLTLRVHRVEGLQQQRS
jgi:hypothetical protein